MDNDANHPQEPNIDPEDGQIQNSNQHEVVEQDSPTIQWDGVLTYFLTIMMICQLFVSDVSYILISK